MSTSPAEGRRPLCFVLMPFKRKLNPVPPPIEIDFDAVYHDLIAPAIDASGMASLRADEEMIGGIIHRPMYERLLLCDFAVADLTSGNPNVFYELGIRHAARPWSTVLLFADGSRLPFDVAPLRGLRYSLTETGLPKDPAPVVETLTKMLMEAKKAVDDSPLFQTLMGFRGPDLTQLAAPSFYDQIQATAAFQSQLDAIVADKTRDDRAKCLSLKQIETAMGALSSQDPVLLNSLFLAYRSVCAWKEMIRFYALLPDYIAGSVSVQEQYALALNRDKEGAKAERVLLSLIDKRGPSSETYGLLGRIYKDRWQDAATSGTATFLARGLLDKAIDAYQRGFDSDPRDYYPGINAVTLMEIRQPPDPRREALVPAVRYALERKMRSAKPGYWEYATAFELAVLGGDPDLASSALASALAESPDSFMLGTTARNLAIIQSAREQRDAAQPWLAEFAATFKQAISSSPKPAI